MELITLLSRSRSGRSIMMATNSPSSLSRHHSAHIHPPSINTLTNMQTRQPASDPPDFGVRVHIWSAASDALGYTQFKKEYKSLDNIWGFEDHLSDRWIQISLEPTLGLGLLKKNFECGDYEEIPWDSTPQKGYHYTNMPTAKPNA